MPSFNDFISATFRCRTDLTGGLTQTRSRIDDADARIAAARATIEEAQAAKSAALAELADLQAKDQLLAQVLDSITPTAPANDDVATSTVAAEVEEVLEVPVYEEGESISALTVKVVAKHPNRRFTSPEVADLIWRRNKVLHQMSTLPKVKSIANSALQREVKLGRMTRIDESDGAILYRAPANGQNAHA